MKINMILIVTLMLLIAMISGCSSVGFDNETEILYDEEVSIFYSDEYYNDFENFKDEDLSVFVPVLDLESLEFEPSLIPILEEYFYHLIQMQDTYFYFNVVHTGTSDGNVFGSPIEGLRAMYRELNERFNYVLLHTTTFDFLGYFAHDEKFIADPIIPNEDLRNELVTHTDGREFMVTPLRGVQIGRMLHRYFDNSVLYGRNFDESDFYVNSPDDMVNVILGYDYIGIFDIGDIIPVALYVGLQFIDFHVIGFLEQGAKLCSGYQVVYFDRSIVMPFFEINYIPVDELNQQFQVLLYSRKSSGMVRISECIELLQIKMGSGYLALLELHARYTTAIVDEMANRHGLWFDVPLLPLYSLIY